MKAFAYATAADEQEAVRLVAGHPGAKFLGGGTNLVDLMKLEVETPDLLVDVSNLPLGTIEGGRVGGAVRNSDLAADPQFRADYPAVSQALLAGASGQLRNMATIAGNLLQRTRCLYFQTVDKPCNKREPGSGCPARTGIHRDLAILGHSEACIATSPSDLAVALAALDAVVRVTGPDGDRTLALDDFYRLPGDDPAHDTTLGPASSALRSARSPAASRGASKAKSTATTFAPAARKAVAAWA